MGRRKRRMKLKYLAFVCCLYTYLCIHIYTVYVSVQVAFKKKKSKNRIIILALLLGSAVVTVNHFSSGM